MEVKSLRDDVVRVLRPMVGRERAKTAYDLYVKASQLDEDPVVYAITDKRSLMLGALVAAIVFLAL